jgi:hypothetical protein
MFRVFAKSTNWGIVLTGMEGLMTRINGPDPKVLTGAKSAIGS